MITTRDSSIKPPPRWSGRINRRPRTSGPSRVSASAGSSCGPSSTRPSASATRPRPAGLDQRWVPDQWLPRRRRGPFGDFFYSLAGDAWVDWLFMLGLLGIGVALILGIGMRIAAAPALVLLVLMWIAVLPLVNNPFMDDHLIYAILAVGLAGRRGRHLARSGVDSHRPRHPLPRPPVADSRRNGRVFRLLCKAGLSS